MSYLGSYGSQDFINASNASKAATENDSQQASLSSNLDPNNVSAANPFQNQTSLTLEQISKAIISPNAVERCKAIKMLICLMSKGTDVHEYAPIVVQQVVANDPTLRQLSYIYLNHYSEEISDTLLLSVNSFQKNLSDMDPIVRAMAIKMISSIPQVDIIPEISSAVELTIGDTSPYVKKAAAYAIIKAAELDPNLIENYLPFIERLLNENNPIAFSGAIAAYWSICPENIEFLHPRFRFICQNIEKFDEYAQIFTIRSMIIYSRLCFVDPKESEEKGETVENFWDENKEEEEEEEEEQKKKKKKNVMMDSDRLLLVSAIKRLLRSPNSGVVLAAVSFIYYCAATTTHVNSIVRPLVRLLYEGPLTSQISLQTIITIASSNNKKLSHVFVPHLGHFYVRKNDNPKIKDLKLKLLSVLASPSNAEMILNEFSRYSCSTDLEFAAKAVKTIGITAMSNQTVIPTVLVSLLRLMSRADGLVLSEVVDVMSHILRLRRQTQDEAQALKHLCQKFVVMRDPSARAAVLAIVGDMHEAHPEFAPQLLRYVAQNAASTPPEVKLQALTLATKLIACSGDQEGDGKKKEQQQQIPIYLMKLFGKDPDFDVQDRARLFLALVQSPSQTVQSRIKDILFPSSLSAKKSSKINNSTQKADSNENAIETIGNATPNTLNEDDVKKDELNNIKCCGNDINLGYEESNNSFQIGTLSHFFGREVSGYEELVDWAPIEELPDKRVRLPVRRLPDGTLVSADAADDLDDGADVKQFFSEYEEEEEEEEEEEDAYIINNPSTTETNEKNDGEEVEYYEYEDEEQENFFD